MVSPFGGRQLCASTRSKAILCLKSKARPASHTGHRGCAVRWPTTAYPVPTRSGARTRDIESREISPGAETRRHLVPERVLSREE